MNITGPVAPPEEPPAAPKRAGMLAGCASGCTTAIGMAFLMVGSAVGAVYEVVQPQHQAVERVPDGSCTFSWWRAATGGARYRITCDATKDLTLTKFKLLSGPRGVELNESTEGWGQAPWEDQRPMSGETITVEGGRSWTYNGTISMGPVPWVGPPGTVTMSAIVDDQKLTFRAVE